MTGNELARVFENSRIVPLGEPDSLPEEGDGWGVIIWAKGKKQLVERDTDDDNDEHDEEKTFVDERTKLKRREVETTTFHAIS
jgi:hypothetical protein